MSGQRNVATLAAKSDEARGERDLIASILLLAVADCSTRGRLAVDAYDWIVSKHPACVAYCQLLEIDPDQFRARIIRKFGYRCEQIRRRFHQHDGAEAFAIASSPQQDAESPA